jgi:uncharacterized protein YaaR (DUF327 family)
MDIRKIDRQAKQGKTERRQSDPGFGSALDDALSDQSHRERLRQLVEDITEQGRRLVDRLDPEELREYRKKIQQFADTVVSGAHKLARERFVDHDGSHRIYSIVQLVDQDLADLAEGLLDRERARLKIVSRVFELRGLLLDVIG